MYAASVSVNAWVAAGSFEQPIPRDTYHMYYAAWRHLGRMVPRV